MRLFFIIPALVFALTASIADAQTSAQSKGQPSRAEVIEACMKEAQASSKTGQKNTMTPMQRRTAEEQCRARAEAEEHSRGATRP